VKVALEKNRVTFGIGMEPFIMTENLNPFQMYEKLRIDNLNLNPEDIGFTKEKFPNPLFGVVVETGFEEGSFSLSVLANGVTKLYFSNGGGLTGGKEHEALLLSNEYLISSSQLLFTKGKIVTDFPKPKPGMVVFYFLTFDGVYSYSSLENDLGAEKDQLSPLFFSMHNVITELRKIKIDPVEQSQLYFF
jgi:hypothetical protein